MGRGDFQPVPSNCLLVCQSAKSSTTYFYNMTRNSRKSSGKCFCQTRFEIEEYLCNPFSKWRVVNETVGLYRVGFLLSTLSCCFYRYLILRYVRGINVRVIVRRRQGAYVRGISTYIVNFRLWVVAKTLSQSERGLFHSTVDKP